MLKSQSAAPQNMTLFGNSVFKRGNQVKKRSFGWASFHMTDVFIKRGNMDTDMQGKKKK